MMKQEKIFDAICETSELIKKVKFTCQIYGYLTALKYQLRKELIHGKEKSILSKNFKNA